MSTELKLTNLAPFCVQKAQSAADHNGFVSTKSLVEGFGAKLVIRPLLVEAVMATTDSDETSPWVVLVDSETFPTTDQDLLKESSDMPLSARFRNTVAHELAHSLGFGQNSAGVRLVDQQKKGETHKEYLHRVESVTESLSPLLLIPQSEIDRLAELTSKPLSLQSLCEFRRKHGVSREVLIRRLEFHKKLTHEFVYKETAFNECAIGLGMWGSDDSSSLNRWPFFSNFRSSVPSFVWELMQYRSYPLHKFGKGSPPPNNFELATTAGTRSFPDNEDCELEISIEETPRSAGGKFLFCVRKLT